MVSSTGLMARPRASEEVEFSVVRPGYPRVASRFALGTRRIDALQALGVGVEEGSFRVGEEATGDSPEQRTDFLETPIETNEQAHVAPDISWG